MWYVAAYKIRDCWDCCRISVSVELTSQIHWWLCRMQNNSHLIIWYDIIQCINTTISGNEGIGNSGWDKGEVPWTADQGADWLSFGSLCSWTTCCHGSLALTNHAPWSLTVTVNYVRRCGIVWRAKFFSTSRDNQAELSNGIDQET